MGEGEVEASGSLGEVATALGSGLSAGLADRDLVARFAARAEGADAAFDVLVHRHGPMVWRLCRRVAGDPEDAADAFQATFLVLVRRAGGVRVGDSLAPWLRGVGLRVARRARGRATRRRARERTNREVALTEATAANRSDGPDPDLRAVLGAELARLPRPFRVTLEACYLDGLTHEGAAEALGCPVGTVRSRLSRGRDLLRSRLARRGLGGSPGGLAALLVDPMPIPIPPGLLAATARLGRSVALARPASVALAGAAARALGGGRLVRLAAPVLGILLLSGAVWALALPGPVPQPPPTADDPDAPLPPITAEALASGVRAAIGRPGIGLLVAEYQDEQIDLTDQIRLNTEDFPQAPDLAGAEEPPKPVAPAERDANGFIVLPPPPPPLPPGPRRVAVGGREAAPKPPAQAETPLRELAEPKPATMHRGPGRFTYRTDGRRWRVEHDGRNLRIGLIGDDYPRDEWAAGFDGVVHYETRDKGTTVELASTRPEAEAEAPGRLFWDGAAAQTPPERDGPGFTMDMSLRHGMQTFRMTETLAPLDAALRPEAEVGQRTVAGYRCYTLTAADPIFNDARVEVVVSPRQSMLPLSVRKLARGQVEHSFAASEPRQLPDGRWYPSRVVVEDWIVPRTAGTKATLKSRRDLRIVRCEPIAAGAGSDLALAVPPNSKVIDHRAGQSYINDPWWPEIHRVLTDELGWPDLDPSPLAALRSPRADLDGRDAPALDVAAWLVGEPIDPTLRDRAATLLVFPFPGDPTLAPVLRCLAAADPSRLRVVTVVPRIADHDDAAERQTLREFRWPGPVAWDGPLRLEYGPTCAPYGLKDHRDLPAAYLVTPEDRVRAFAQGQGLAAINEQLAALGGRPLAFPPPEAIGIGRRFRQLVRSWTTCVQAAPATGRLAGSIVDRAGRPVPGARVRAVLFAEVATRIDAASSGGWTVRKLGFDRAQEATTDSEGRFAVDRLCKGNYAVRVSAPGHAATEATAVVPEGRAVVDFRLALSSDAIAGTIRDEAGRPVAGALVEVFNRHARSANGSTTMGLGDLFTPKRTATADAAGQFRCGPLPDGLYSVRATAPGHAEEIRYDVAAGTEAADFALKRLDALPPRGEGR